MFGHSSVGGGGGVAQLPLASLTIPAGTDVCSPSMFGHWSVGGGGGVTQLPLVSLIIPVGTDAWVPAMFGHGSGGGGGGVQPLVDREITIELSGFVPLLEGVPFPQARSP